MAGETTKLVLGVEQHGAEQTAAALGTVDAAQQKVAGTASEAGKATDKQTDATKKATASNEDFFNVLNKVHPGLGELAQTFSRASKVAGDLATKNIDLKGSFDTVKKAVMENAGALKLLAAGGAVAIGIGLVSAAIGRMREEFEKATKAIQDNAAAMDVLRGKQLDQQASIEKIADARKRVAPITADQSRQAQQDAAAIKERLPDLDESSINQAAGGLAGLGLDRATQEKAAILIDRRGLQLKSSGSPERIRQQVERAISRDSEFLSGFTPRETDQGRSVVPGAALGGGELGEAARRQAVAVGGAKVDLEQFIAQRVTPGTDVKRLGELTQKFGTIGGLEEGLSKAAPGRDALALVRSIFGNADVPTQDKDFTGLGAERVSLSKKEIADLTVVLRDLTKEMGKGGGATILNQNNYGSDAAAKERRSTNNGRARVQAVGIQ